MAMNVRTDAPVGVWSGLVHHDGQADEFTISFGADGSVSLRTPVSTGRGAWVAEGPGRFSYDLKEEFTKESGLTGYVDIHVDARFEENVYSGVGTAKVYNGEGAVVHSTTAEFTADRRSHSPADWH